MQPAPPGPVVPPPAAQEYQRRQFHPLEHYPWATQIEVPDATFGAGGSTDHGFKNKYNLPQGTALPPMRQVEVDNEALARKAMFRNDQTTFHIRR